MNKVIIPKISHDEFSINIDQYFSKKKPSYLPMQQICKTNVNTTAIIQEPMIKTSQRVNYQDTHNLILICKIQKFWRQRRKALEEEFEYMVQAIIYARHIAAAIIQNYWRKYVNRILQ